MPSESQTPSELPFATRLWFAWVCLIRVLFDGSFAAQAWRARQETKALPPVPRAPDRLAGGEKAEGQQRNGQGEGERADASDGLSTPQGLQLLSILQREGRLVDFLEQDVTAFSDEEVGAAARVVHEGCRKALHRVTSVEPVRSESEGAKVVLETGFAPSEVVLVGNVQGTPPYRGVLRHRGWRVKDITLPEVVPGHDPHVLAPAEVEL